MQLHVLVKILLVWYGYYSFRSEVAIFFNVYIYVFKVGKGAGEIVKK